MLYLLYIVAASIVLLLLFAFVTKKEYTIISEVIIDKEKDVVFNYIIHLKNQEQYNKWIVTDPNVKIKYTGTDGTVGFTSAWESGRRDVVGEQELTSIILGEGYTSELRFEKPFKGVSYTKVIAHAVTPNQTKVTATFDTRTEFPMSAMIPLLKKMLKKDTDITAQNLKRVIETNY
jgi:hypothetical protein